MYGLPDPHKSKPDASKSPVSAALPGMMGGLEDPYGFGAMNPLFNPYAGYNQAAAAALQMQLQYAAAAQNQMMMAGEISFGLVHK